jgi:DNA-binding CsgD family transcriptional regulator
MGEILLDLHENHTIKHYNKINSICSPLAQLGSTNYFSYQKVMDNGSYGGICNHPAYSEFYLANQFYHYDTFLKHPSYYNLGVNIFLIKNVLAHNNDDPLNFIVDHCINTFSFQQFLILIIREINFYEVFCFATSLTDNRALQLYLNELDLIKNFIKYFKSNMSTILHEVCDTSANVKEFKNYGFMPSNQSIKTTLDEEEREILLKKFSPQEYAVKQQIKNLTPREKESLYWILRGKTADETAKILNISKRTVEIYRNSCKAKLGGYLNLNSLCYLIGKYNLLA